MADTPSLPPPSTTNAAEAEEEGLELLAQGAEARVYVLAHFVGGRPAVVKERFAKSYRLPELDQKLTRNRVQGVSRSFFLVRPRDGVRLPNADDEFRPPTHST